MDVDIDMDMCFTNLIEEIPSIVIVAIMTGNLTAVNEFFYIFDEKYIPVQEIFLKEILYSNKIVINEYPTESHIKSIIHSAISV